MNASFLRILACAVSLVGAGGPGLRLVATIPMPAATGRFDHSAVDPLGHRLFVTLRDAGTVDVVDLRARRVVRSIGGFARPQGAFYVTASRKLFVTSALDGTCKVVSGDSFEVLATLPLSFGANVIAYDPRAHQLFIGHGGGQVGDAPTERRGPGRIAIVDAMAGELVGDIETDPTLRPGAIVVDASGPKLFTANALGSEVVVVDRARRAVISKWKVEGVERSGSLALDPVRRRLFVGTRTPALVVVFDADTGRRVTSFATVEGIDRLHYDPAARRLYASGSPKGVESDGAIEAYRQKGADAYERVARTPTGPDGGTSLFVAEAGRLYAALPRHRERSAEVRVYDTRP